MIGLVAVVLLGVPTAFTVGDRPEKSVSGSWRYKMTVAVETPEGLKSGSAVREVSNAASESIIKIPHITNPADLKGEAVVVDLGERGVLFALLRGMAYGEDYAKDLPFYVFPSDQGYSTMSGIRHYSALKDAKAVLTPVQYPLLVTFRDMKDPKTVAPVLEGKLLGTLPNDGYEITADHFAELFGAGVKLKDITIEMTDEPVTWGVEKWLPWLKNLKTNLDGSKIVTSGLLANNIGAGSFKRGEK